MRCQTVPNYWEKFKDIMSNESDQGYKITKIILVKESVIH